MLLLILQKLDMHKPLIIDCRGHQPNIDPTCWLAPNATVIGEVSIGPHSSCWFQSVVRGDVASISIGSRVNIQDGAVIHGTFEKSETRIDDDASIGHNAIVHGAHIGRFALIGMGAIVMDGAQIGAHAVVAAGAVVLQNTIVPPGTLWAGVPAVQRGMVRENLKSDLMQTSNRYIEYAKWFKPHSNG